MIRLRIEADRASSRETLIRYAIERGACRVRRRKDPLVFTCSVDGFYPASSLLVDMRHKFPRAYFQGWVMPQ